MHCISPLFLALLLYSATLVSGSRKSAHRLHFIKEPESQLSRADGSRIHFVCNASPPEATIKWLRNGSIIKNDDYEWIKVNGNKLILQVTKSFHSSSPQNHSQSVASSNEVYQCLAELGNLRIVSQPAKLIIGELNPFESPENNQDKSLTAIAGNTAVVPCDLPPGVPFVISEFEFGNITIATSYDRYRLVPSGSLQIFHAKPIDSGSYRCVANNPYLAEKVYAHHFVNLKVIRHRHVPASERNKISWEVTPKKVTSSILGQNITIECVAKGHPTPKIYWERLNGQLDKERNHIDGGNLHITTLGKSDEGTYVCVASNGKHTLRAETNLEVSEIPQIVNSEPYEVLDVEEGHDLDLSCEAKGFPRPFITWLHNGYIINNVQGLHSLFTFKNDDTVLNIRNANASHSGILQCFMTNQLGSTYSIKMVNVRSVSAASSSASSSTSSSSTSSSSSSSSSAVAAAIPHSDSFPASGFPGHSKHRGSQSEQMPSREDNEDLFLNADDDGEAGGTFEIRNGNHNYDTTLANRAKKRKHKNMKLIPPNNPVVSALNEDSVMVRWSVSKQGGLRITFFKVQFREAGKNEVITVDEEIPAHIFSYSVSGLTNSAKYRFRIAAVYENNDNAKSNWTKFHFPRNAAAKKPIVPPIIRSAAALGLTEITLHWELSRYDGAIEGFFIYYRPSESAGEYLKATSLGAETREHRLSHLSPGMMYEIKMRSFNPSGTSEFSNIYTIQTLPAKDSLPVPTEPSHPNSPPSSKPDWPYPPETLLLFVGAITSSLIVVCLVFCFIRCKSQAPAPKVIKKGKVLKSSTPSDYYFNSTNVYDRRPNGQLAVAMTAVQSSRNNSLKPPPPVHQEAETDGKQLNTRLNALNEMSSLNRKNSFRNSLSHSTHHLFNTTNGKVYDGYLTATAGSAVVSTATIDRKRMIKSSIEKPPYLEYPPRAINQHSASFTRLNGTLERKRKSRTDLNTIDRSYLRNLSAAGTAISEMDRQSNGNAAFLGSSNGPIVIMQSSC